MPTNQNRIEITDNRLLSKEDMKDNFLEYIEDLTDETVAAFLQGKSGVFESTEITLQEDSTTEDFELFDLTTPKRVAVATGKVITLYGSLVGETSEIVFENTLGANYEVGIRWNQRADQASINPKRGYPEYRSKKDVFGEVGAPDTVTDLGTSIRLWINGLTDPTGSHTFAGRTARAWLDTPVSGDDSVAFYEGTIAYDGGTGENYLAIPYSGGSGPLGQDTSASAPSTTASDYRVHVLGPSIRKGTNTAIKTDADNYVFLGSITGAGVGSSATYSMVGQVKVFLITLDNAYDGQGSGAGNEINVDVANKPVTLNSFQTSPSIRPNQKNILDVYDPDDALQIRFEQYGRIATTPRFSDEFMYPQSKWTSAATTPDQYVATEGGTGVVRMLDNTHAVWQNVKGAVRIVSPDALATNSRLQGAEFSCYTRRPRFFSRFAIKGVEATYTAYIGISDAWDTAGALDGPFIGFRIINGAVVGHYKAEAGTTASTATLATLADDTILQGWFVCTDNVTAEFWVTGMTTPVSLTLQDDLDADPTYWALSLGGRVESEVGSANDHELVVDFWEIQLDGDVRAAV